MKPIPTKEQILQWISDNPTLTAKRDIAKAFGVKDAGRIELKRLLRELEADGALAKRGRSYRDAEALPPVSILVMLPPDAQGDQWARPMEWAGEGAEPRILFVARKADAPVAEGERILARLTEVQDEAHRYEARLIRKIGSNPLSLLGIFRKDAEGGRIVPIDKGVGQGMARRPLTRRMRRETANWSRPSRPGPNRLGLPQARVLARLGDPSAPRAVSLIAIHQHGIPDHFPDAVIAEADAASPAGMQGARICATCRLSRLTRRRARP